MTPIELTADMVAFNQSVELAMKDPRIPLYAQQVIADLYLRLYGKEWGANQEREIRNGN